MLVIYQCMVLYPFAMTSIRPFKIGVHQFYVYCNTLSKHCGYMRGRCVNDDVIKGWHFLRYWPFVRGIHRSPMKSPHKGQWRGALMFSLIYAWTNGWVNNRDAGDWIRHRAHHDVTVMCTSQHTFYTLRVYVFCVSNIILIPYYFISQTEPWTTYQAPPYDIHENFLRRIFLCFGSNSTEI